MPGEERSAQAACALVDVMIQARKTDVSLMSPPRTFARIQEIGSLVEAVETCKSMSAGLLDHVTRIVSEIVLGSGMRVLRPTAKGEPHDGLAQEAARL